MRRCYRRRSTQCPVTLSFVAKWMCSLLVGTVLSLCVFELSACGILQAAKTANAESNAWLTASRAAPSACSKAHLPSTFAAATYAGAAANELRAVHEDPEPWNTMPRLKLIFACYGSLAGGVDGTYLDSSGHESPAPPLGAGEHCKSTVNSETCSLQAVNA